MPCRQVSDDAVIIQLAPAKVPELPMTRREKREKLKTAQQENQAKYDAGIPFFTKDLFRHVVKQFDARGHDRTISLPGLDGVNVQFHLQPGEEYLPHHYGDDRVCIITKPRLGYHQTRQLLPGSLFTPSVSCIHLPVEVTQSTEVRDAQTKEIVSLWPTSDYTTVRQELEQARQSLEGSEHFTQLRASLVSAVLPLSINKVFALACNTMDWSGIEHKRSVAQHALALSLRDLWTMSSAPHAEDKRAGGLTCYAQDPIYTAVDHQVLGDVGFTVVEDPRAFIEVDDTSLVICVNPDIPVREIIADIARPIVLIWNRVVPHDPGSPRADPVSPRVEQMMADYFELPFDAHEELLRGCAIYIRKADSIHRQWDLL